MLQKAETPGSLLLKVDTEGSHKISFAVHNVAKGRNMLKFVAHSVAESR